MEIFGGVVLFTGMLFFALLAWASFKEKEKRALIISLLFLFLNIIFCFAFIFLLETTAVHTASVIALAVVILFALVSLIQWFPQEIENDQEQIDRFDERDHMFSRNNLQYYPDVLKKYYELHPEKFSGDTKIHALPELAENGGEYFDELMAPLCKAQDYFTGITTEAAKLKKAKHKIDITPQRITDIICRAAKHLGAKDAGVTRLRTHHFYTHHGRNITHWGKEIRNEHTHAIAILIPMRLSMVNKAPTFPEILESTQKYVEAAKIAHIIASYIKLLGYDAKAHFDANYELICAVVAKDAGLGEIGRLSLLMHPVCGPCARLVVVTTEMEMEETKPKKNYHMENFCRICKKCADNCPTGSIEKGQKKTSRGFAHWSILQEKCLAFWKKMGTDCGICIRVCPYTKPDTLVHKLVRFYISRNPLNQRIALFFDDLLYGRKIKLPKSNPPIDEMLN